jgi:hypothetical protein
MSDPSRDPVDFLAEACAPPRPAEGALPCPFCGGVAELLHWIEIGKFQVRCHRCRASTWPLAFATDALAFWNRRITK